MRRQPWFVWAVLPLIVALVGNLATNTVQVNAAWWPAAIWGVVIILGALSVVADRRASRPQRATEHNLTKVVDALASDLKEEWTAATPGLLIDVKWTRADSPDLIDHWTNVNRSDNTLPPLAAHGSLNNLAETYRRIPSGRMVVLGGPGAGKSIAVFRCALGLLEGRESGEPIPYVASINSWKPDVTLADWLVARLEDEHSELAAIDPSGRSLAAGLVSGGFVVPILDGFDELPPGYQAAALRHLTDEARRPLVLTSRADQYAAAVAATRVLAAAAVVELADLSIGLLAPHLRSAVAGERSGVWEPVIQVLHREPLNATGRHVSELLATPLMVYLACERYSDNTAAADPTELLDAVRFPDRAALERHLIAEFLPAVYRRRSGERYSCSAADAHRWLAGITREMRLMGLDLLARHNIGARVVDPTRSFMLSLLVGVTYVLPFGALMALMFGRWAGNAIVLTVVASYALSYGLQAARGPGSPPVASAGRQEPDQRSRFERWADDHLSVPVRVYLLLPLMALVPAAIGWFVIGPWFALGFWFATYVVGTYWVPWLVVARVWLPLRGRLPWRQRAFLEDACARGVLRRVGTKYQVRHALLANYLRLASDVPPASAPDGQDDRPLPAVLNAVTPHLRFRGLRAIATVAGTAATVVVLGRQVWLHAGESLWWLLTVPVAVLLASVVFLQLCSLFRPFERFRIRLDPIGIAAEVAPVGWEFWASDSDPVRRLIEWEQIERVEQSTCRGRAVLVIHTRPGVPGVAAARRLPRFEPSLGDNVVLVCPIDYFDPAADLVATVREAHRRYATAPLLESGGCVADLDDGVSPDAVAAWAADAWAGHDDARRRIDQVVNGLYERHEHNGLELRHCPLATSLDALVHRTSDAALFNLQDRQEVALLARAVDLIKSRHP
ncbi:hypothetical protein ACFV9C_11925 [Kribbella sp. NPDC059898]|uniref:hypothetical protein n=1 Tax=Kribbella sp. NPDC059898 TaxID=3346995 RepID=UPI00365595E6